MASDTRVLSTISGAILSYNNELLPLEDGSTSVILLSTKEAEIIEFEGMGCGIREPQVGASALYSYAVRPGQDYMYAQGLSFPICSLGT